MLELQANIERLFALGADVKGAKRDLAEAQRVFIQFRKALSQGKIRAAEKLDGRWRTNVWVKQGILLGFMIGEHYRLPLVPMKKDTRAKLEKIAAEAGLLKP